MFVLIDTNILISTALFPKSVSAMAFIHAVTYPNRAAVCDYSLSEMRHVFHKKFPHKLSIFETFASVLSISAKIISTPDEIQKIKDEEKIRDIKDRPILRAAIHAKVDAILTGDKDFLESGISNPKLLSTSDFLEL